MTLLAARLILIFISIMPVACHASEYARGIWFDRAGLTKQNLKPTVDNLEHLHINSVHIVISSLVTDMGLFATCRRENPKSLPAAHQCAAKKYVFGFDKWAESPQRATLPSFIDALHARQMTVYLMIWPVPTKSYVTSVDRLIQFVARHPVEGVEIEDEENWGPTYISGYKTNNEAAVALIGNLRKGLPAGTLVGATAAPRNFAADHFTNDLLVKLADFFSYQTYQGVCGRGGDHCSITKLSGQYAAGTMQDRAVALLQKIPLKPGAKLILGLPAYDQAVGWYGGEVNMFRSLSHAICSDAGSPKDRHLVEIAYWSQANVASRTGDGAYARRFLSGCQAKDINMSCTGDAKDKPETLNKTCPAVYR